MRNRCALGLALSFLVVGHDALAGSATRQLARPSSPAAHRPIFLRTASGAVIHPLTGENAAEPYSPAQTCGASKCHDYDAITQGYHFQMGARRLREGFDPARPWALSPGKYGGHAPGVLRLLAPKTATSASKMDATAWEWATAPLPSGEPCASCHPGGGPMERDRSGQRYDDALRKDPARSKAFDGDYFQSAWDKSGVLEADCLFCHAPSFDARIRAQQLRAQNLRWAATAAAGLGTVEGVIFDERTQRLTGVTPRVSYNKRLFNEDGRVVLTIAGKPDDRNCLQCHAAPSLKKRGFTWHDPQNPDVHAQQGMRCVHCHGSGLDHNFATARDDPKRDRPGVTVPSKGCAGCHTTGSHGASVPAHNAIPPSHLKKLACQTCHIPAIRRSAARLHDLTRGDSHMDTLDTERVGRAEEWYPAYTRVGDKLAPIRPIVALWWGNEEDDGRIHPLFAKEVRAAWQRVAPAIQDDDGDGVPDFNRDDEIAAGLEALRDVLAASGRFRRVQPALVKRKTIYRLARAAGAAGGGSIERVVFDQNPSLRGHTLNHNVGPAKSALGTAGCADCHSQESKLFARTYVADPFDAQGREIREPVYRSFGLRDDTFKAFSIYWSLARPWIGVVLFSVFFLLTLHFTRFGRHDFGGRVFEPRADDWERVQRFSWSERMLHLTVLLTFLFLGFTGLCFSFDGWRWLQLAFGETVTPRVWHSWLGYVFGGGVVLMLFRWTRDSLLVSSDWKWVRSFGGYLGGHEPSPAGRFNAGQKVFFWTVVGGGIVLTATGILLHFKEALSMNTLFLVAALHNLAGLFGVAGVLSHVYLSTAANPGTAQAIFAGWVTKGWARLHHPLWYEKLFGKKAFTQPFDKGDDTAKKAEPKDEA